MNPKLESEMMSTIIPHTIYQLDTVFKVEPNQLQT